MPKLEVEGVGIFEVPEGTRLVRALTDIAGVSQLHACGGAGKCTTCRVEFIEGEPDAMTEREEETLRERGVVDARLSCQIAVTGDMKLRARSTLENSERSGCGPVPTAEIEPEPNWIEKG